MSAWIPITILAAFVQNLRFMLQKHLKATQLTTGGATFARFFWSAPLAALIVGSYVGVSGADLPPLSGNFWAFALAGGLAQILATLCVVALFSMRNFAVGMTFKKTEAIQTGIIGFLLLGEGISLTGGLAIGIGFLGLLALAEPGGEGGRGLRRYWDKPAGLGLLSGVLFAISANGYRGASLSLEFGDIFLRASLTLACVTAFQAISMALWLRWREPGQISRVLQTWRVSALVGLTSLVGSLCWFLAFTLQTAAYVKVLGQIELIFSYAASVFVFGERPSRREIVGMVLIVASVIVMVFTI